MPHPNPPRSRRGGSRTAADGGGGPKNLRRENVYEARQARQDLSLPEVLLWQRLKGAPEGIRFRKQHPVGPYRADFYCAPAKLVIEVDGAVHNAGDRPERDQARTDWLIRAGYDVVRIPAADVLRDPDDVTQAIVTLAARPLHPDAARRGPPPRERGGSAPPRDGEVAAAARLTEGAGPQRPGAPS